MRRRISRSRRHGVDYFKREKAYAQQFVQLSPTPLWSPSFFPIFSFPSSLFTLFLAAEISGCGRADLRRQYRRCGASVQPEEEGARAPVRQPGQTAATAGHNDGQVAVRVRPAARTSAERADIFCWWGTMPCLDRSNAPVHPVCWRRFLFCCCRI